ncbi:MAG: excinuclease ABC subunit UvrA, partial [Bacteroidota bacterium]
DQGETLLSTKFSFNHKDGACPACNGLGVITTADPEKFITHPECSLLNGALDGTKTGKFYGDPYGQFTNLLIAVGNKLGMDFGKPYNELSNDERETAIYGAGDRIFKAEWRYKRKNRDGVHAFSKKWEGFAALINEEYQRKHADNRGESMMDVMADITCPDCRGSRLSKTALGYTFRQLSMNDLTALSIEAAITFFGKKEDKNELAKPVLDEIVKRLTVLNKLGLGYLSTGRSSDSLSGGESQRLRLSSLLSGELTGITYILDEPTIGLHPTEIARLKEVINKLNELGNTVVIIEHDQEIIRMADHIIEFGPGAGRNGGHIVFKGTYGELMKQPGSLTAEWMAKPLPAVKQATTADDHIYIKNARANNLKNISLSFPLKMMSVVTGVSGAGKSSLLFDVLNATAVAGKPVNCDAIEGLEQFSNIIDLRQRNMHGSLSGNTLTYNGLFEHLRDIFASLEAAKKAGYKKAHFSFNRPGGRCEHCKGTGRIRISMDFMPDIHEECEVCHGRQFQPGILDCRINEKNIHEVLQMTVDELAEFHGKIPGYHKKFAGGLSLLQDTGLGYLVCGQATSTLSGGEAQRLQLVRELIKTPKGSRLYLFDEPTTGLHPADTSKLLTVFDRLLAEGHTIILTEHDRQITGHAGYVIQLGPGGGENGGRLT